MQFVGEEGVRVRELEALARTGTNSNGLERWGYVVVAPDPNDTRQKPPRSDWIIRATPAGRRAQKMWLLLLTVVEKRWVKRFGKDEMAALRESLRGLIHSMDVELPDSLPFLGYGLYSQIPKQRPRAPTSPECYELPLPALLSRVLLAFAIQFELRSPLSLAISANVLRVLNEEGVRLRDIPVLAGVSKEMVAVSLAFLVKAGFAIVGNDPDKRSKAAGLTTKGVHYQKVYHVLTQGIEGSWHERFGSDAIRDLRANLEPLVGDATSNSPLFRGLEPYPDGWRAKILRPKTLPHYPLITHRGGYPDGS
jgi:hypothetical protein